MVEYDVKGLSRDPEVVKNYLEDPLNYTGKVRARMGREMLRAETLTSSEALTKIKTPALILHGGDDRVVDPLCSTTLYNAISSTDKELVILRGFTMKFLIQQKKIKFINV